MVEKPQDLSEQQKAARVGCCIRIIELMWKKWDIVHPLTICFIQHKDEENRKLTKANLRGGEVGVHYLKIRKAIRRRQDLKTSFIGTIRMGEE